MEMENRYNSSAYGPSDRLIRFGGHSLETAYRFKNYREVTADSTGCDDRSCRIRLNAAEREIDRARNGLDRNARWLICDTVELSHEHEEDNRPPSELSSPPTERKAYAPDPLGKPSPVTELPPEEAKPKQMINFQNELFVGSIIDLLM